MIYEMGLLILRKRKLVSILVAVSLLIGGCSVDLQGFPKKTSGNVLESSTPVDTDMFEYLTPPIFIEKPVFCKVAQDYLSLSKEDFSEQYTENQLWEMGIFDHLLFTSTAKGAIIGNISIGDTLEKVEQSFGESQFSTESDYTVETLSYQRFLLYGYKTKDCYFVFQIVPATKKVQSICIRKRYSLPENRDDILVKLSTEYTDWFGVTEYTDEMNAYLDKSVTTYAQWGRGTMTIISDYGFFATSGMGDTYNIFADFEGIIPKLATQTDTYDGSEYEPISLFEVDYPEQMIYNIYDYMSQKEQDVEGESKVLSPSGNISASTRSGNSLDMQKSSLLYENAHVLFCWKDRSKVDKQVYFGHFSTLVGFLNERYFVQSNMLGLSVYDLDQDLMVYSDDDMDESGRVGLWIDFENSAIRDETDTIRYRYSIAGDGGVQMTDEVK